jgi:riboflavin kinase
MAEQIKSHLWFTLYTLLKLGASKTDIKLSTTELAGKSDSSQQSASRHLRILEEMGLIKREVDAEGSKIKITNEGLRELEMVFEELKWHIEGREAEAITIKGVVVSGLFEGAYYISKEGYRSQIEEKLGFDPYPGTLNVRIKPDDMEKRKRIERRSGILLEGFKEEHRAYGSARCYHVIINGEIDGALIVAERSIHDDNILEIIAPVYLRRQLKIADGDPVTLEFVPLRRSAF